MLNPLFSLKAPIRTLNISGHGIDVLNPEQSKKSKENAQQKDSEIFKSHPPFVRMTQPINHECHVISPQAKAQRMLQTSRGRVGPSSYSHNSIERFEWISLENILHNQRTFIDIVCAVAYNLTSFAIGRQMEFQDFR
jgi:hypothetical protein